MRRNRSLSCPERGKLKSFPTSEVNKLNEEEVEIHDKGPIQKSMVKTTGKLIINVGSAIGKENEFLRIVGSENQEQCKDDIQGKLSVYIGDSITDILAMYRADVGILIGSSQSFMKVAKHFGIRILPLHFARIEASKTIPSSVTSSNKPKPLFSRKKKSFTIYHATNWNEIDLLLHGDSIIQEESQND